MKKIITAIALVSATMVMGACSSTSKTIPGASKTEVNLNLTSSDIEIGSKISGRASVEYFLFIPYQVDGLNILHPKSMRVGNSVEDANGILLQEPFETAYAPAGIIPVLSHFSHFSHLKYGLCKEAMNNAMEKAPEADFVMPMAVERATVNKFLVMSTEYCEVSGKAVTYKTSGAAQ